MVGPVSPERQGSGRSQWSLAAAGIIIAVGGVALLLRCKFFSVHTDVPAAKPIVSHSHPPHNEQPRTAFEPSDWSLAPIALVYLGTLALLVVSCFVLITAYPGSLPDVARTLRMAPPGPRLQTDPADDLRRFQAKEEQRLNNYYWIDRQKGIVHIPIDQAMKNLAAAGIAGFPKEQP